MKKSKFRETMGCVVAGLATLVITALAIAFWVPLIQYVVHWWGA